MVNHHSMNHLMSSLTLTLLTVNSTLILNTLEPYLTLSFCCVQYQDRQMLLRHYFIYLFIFAKVVFLKVLMKKSLTYHYT